MHAQNEQTGDTGTTLFGKHTKKLDATTGHDAITVVAIPGRDGGGEQGETRT